MDRTYSQDVRRKMSDEAFRHDAWMAKTTGKIRKKWIKGLK